MTGSGSLDDTLRRLAPRVLASLMRSSHDFATNEDAVQEALVAAATQWPANGWPDNPKGWLVTVATRRRIEMWRNDAARHTREHNATSNPDGAATDATDDTLELFMLCCHPAITPTSQIALTLRAVGGLTTAEIARALLVPETTVAQRISRAKATIRAAGSTFPNPTTDDHATRLAAVRHVLYLIFNEGYLATAGEHANRLDLSAEAIRLTRHVHHERPNDGETVGLLALMLLTDARRPARTTSDGALVPLTEQDRTLWQRTLIEEGTSLLDEALRRTLIGPYQLQAAIAALHAEAPTAQTTDWPQILALYDHLAALAPGPTVTLNRLVAVSMVNGPQHALTDLDHALATDADLQRNPRVHSVRAHLLERSGDIVAAADEYEQAATKSLNLPEKRFLQQRAATLRTP